jgi:hypothetical protein
LDAYSNYWNAKKSFGKLFEEAIRDSYSVINFEEFSNKFDNKYCYSFILQHPEHLSINYIDKEMVFNVNKINLQTLEEELPDLEFEKIDLTIDQLDKNTNYLVYFLDKETNKVVERIKVFSNEFLHKKELLENYQNLGLKYLSIILNFSDKELLRNVFPIKDNYYYNIDQLFLTTVNNIYKLYIEIYVNKNRQDLPYRYRKLIYDIHNNYITTRNVITKQYIMNTLSTLEPKLLANIIGFSY